MYYYGITEAGHQRIEFVSMSHESKTPWLIWGGKTATEERAKLLLRKLIKKLGEEKHEKVNRA